jgi:polyvinyl alcohol dehydrogenase (cytochrome)
MKKSIQLLLLVSLVFGVSSEALSASLYPLCKDNIKKPLQVISSGLSRDYSQQRVYSKAETGLDKKRLQALKPQWTMVFDDAIHPRSTPAITEQLLFIGSEAGQVFALNNETGCGYWHSQVEAEVRTAISVAEVAGRWLLFFGDLKGNAYALDAINGKTIWQIKADTHPEALITGSPVYVDGKLLVPISSLESAATVNPLYNCCSFQGGLLALDAATGAELWRFKTIEEVNKSIGKNALGVELYGPSGAAVWSPPTVDVKGRRVFIGTGQNYHEPATAMANAIIALDLDSGKKLWYRKTVKKDQWNSACSTGIPGTMINCPDDKGMDYDFGAPPIFVEVDGKAMIIAGQKSGWAYAMDADNGDIIWQKQVGRGGILGGVHWGMAADNKAVYVPIADTDVFILDNTPGEPRSGLYKLDIKTGETLWYTPAFFECVGVSLCKHGLSQTITVVEDFVLAGGLDGVLRAYDTETGALFWQFDSKQETVGVNGVKGAGGTLDAAPVVAAKGKLFFNSGYGGFFSVGSKAGNVFWVLQ